MKENESKKIAVSVVEAADMISVSRAKMYELIKSEDCDFMLTIGGRRLVSVKKLEAWVERQTGKQNGYEPLHY